MSFQKSGESQNRFWIRLCLLSHKRENKGITRGILPKKSKSVTCAIPSAVKNRLHTLKGDISDANERDILTA